MRLLYAAVLFAASGIFPGCHEPKVPWRGAGLELSLPKGVEPRLKGDEDSGRLEAGPLRLAWDLDARTGPLKGATETMVGHPARAEAGGLTWRCDKTHRLFHLEGAARPEKLNCHRRPLSSQGDVPAIAVAQLPWRMVNRRPGAASWSSGAAAMTLFSGQQAQPPADPAEAAPEWFAAAGLQDVVLEGYESAGGPQGHPATLVKGHGVLSGRPVKVALLVWRCLQRQRTFVGVSFAPDGDVEAPLRAARCHG